MLVSGPSLDQYASTGRPDLASLFTVPSGADIGGSVSTGHLKERTYWPGCRSPGTCTRSTAWEGWVILGMTAVHRTYGEAEHPSSSKPHSKPLEVRGRGRELCTAPDGMVRLTCKLEERRIACSHSLRPESHRKAPRTLGSGSCAHWGTVCKHLHCGNSSNWTFSQ